MEKKTTNIKERILQIAKDKGVSYELFLEKLDLKYANFKGKQKLTGINSNSIEKIVSKYSEVDLHWLITGKKKKEDITGASIVNETGDRNIDVLERELAHAKELVQAKNETIASLQRALEIIGDRDGSSKAS